MFLSFDGRLRRLHFWIGFIILWVVEMVIVSVTIGGAMSTAAMTHNYGAMMAGPAAIGWLLLLALMYPALALYTKRWHDRDKSGWMSLIAFIPFIGGLWMLIECGFLDGTPGPNKYGPSPKGLGGAAAVNPI
jgi:uncharacterized membrane protein YhaH (DUF805 family)